MIQISRILKNVPIFRMLSKESIDFIVERLKFKTFEQKETICKVGDPGDTMFIIISGGVDILIYGSSEKEEQVVATLGPGDYFGEMALLTGETRSATVRSIDSSEMFVLYKNDFDVILEKFPSISLSMGKIVSKRLRETLSKAASIPRATITKDSGPSGTLEEMKLVDLVVFCENNSLTGELLLKKDGTEGRLVYEKGELMSVKAGDLKDDKALDEMLTWEQGEFAIKPKPLTLDTKKGKTEESKKILIVNNSLVVRKLIERAFKGLGYDVSTAENIQKSKEVLSSATPNIVVTDVKLADGSGIDLCKTVRADKNIPFIFLSDDSIKPEFETELKSLVNVNMAKTHEVSEIVKLVENMI